MAEEEKRSEGRVMEERGREKETSKQGRGGEMAQQIKCLPHKYEDPSTAIPM